MPPCVHSVNAFCWLCNEDCCGPDDALTLGTCMFNRASAQHCCCCYPAQGPVAAAYAAF